MTKRRLLAGAACALIGGIALIAAPVGCAQNVEGYRVLQAYPHDSQAFTQGLVYLDGHLFESTGMYGQSTLREDDLETGRVIREVSVPSQYFAEGLTNWGSTLIQLTWKDHLAFVYDRSTFRLIKTFHYPWEGWGLTQDGKHLILSDGSDTIHFLDPETFKEVRSIRVTANGHSVDQLNELEYIHGEIYANVWMTNKIARISPQTGKVIAWIKLDGLLPSIEQGSRDAVLNGIAYDSAHSRLFVTGKLWPRLYQIQVVKKK